MISSGSYRLLKNTAALYFRMFINMSISLYISRITLDILGVEDFGIYNVVGGIVILMTILTAAFSNCSQRFFSTALGKNSLPLLRKYFLTILNVHLLMAVIFIILGEICAYWLIHHYLTIPIHRIDAASTVFHLSLVTSAFNLTTVPFIALIMATENISFYAAISIIEQIIKLALVLLLSKINGDLLIYYALFLFGLSISIRLSYRLYCQHKFKEIVKYQFVIHKKELHEIWTFVSWSYLGNFSGILKEQGINIVIGHWFGVSVNAARGISMQVFNAISAFGNNFIAALRPQITKSYAAGNIEKSIHLASVGTRMTFYLMFFLANVLFYECPFILHLWLKEVPAYAIDFTRLITILSLLRIIQEPLVTLYLAVGNIKASQIASAIYTIICIAICILIFSLGFSPIYSVYVSCLLELANYTTALYLLHKLIPIKIGLFLKKTYFPILAIFLISNSLLLLLRRFIEDAPLKSFFGTIIYTILVIPILIWLLGITESEKDLIKQIIRKKTTKNG